MPRHAMHTANGGALLAIGSADAARCAVGHTDDAIRQPGDDAARPVPTPLRLQQHFDAAGHADDAAHTPCLIVGHTDDAAHTPCLIVGHSDDAAHAADLQTANGGTNARMHTRTHARTHAHTHARTGWHACDTLYAGIGGADDGTSTVRACVCAGTDDRWRRS